MWESKSCSLKRPNFHIVIILVKVFFIACSPTNRLAWSGKQEITLDSPSEGLNQSAVRAFDKCCQAIHLSSSHMIPTSGNSSQLMS